MSPHPVAASVPGALQTSGTHGRTGQHQGAAVKAATCPAARMARPFSTSASPPFSRGGSRVRCA